MIFLAAFHELFFPFPLPFPLTCCLSPSVTFFLSLVSESESESQEKSSMSSSSVSESSSGFSSATLGPDYKSTNIKICHMTYPLVFILLKVLLGRNHSNVVALLKVQLFFFTNFFIRISTFS